MALEYEFEGKTVEKAIKEASRALEIPKNELRYDVISYGSTGIFGLVGTKKAKIRVFVSKKKAKDIPENAPEPVVGNLQYEKASEDIIALVDSTFETEESSTDDLEEAMDTGEDALKKIIEAISDGAEIKKEIKKGEICFYVEGGNSGVLIGKRGQTLEAIQYIIEKVVNRKREPRVNVRLDIQGYLEKREKTLIKMAERLAEKAKRLGKPMTIGQMNSQDRRTVHLALRGDPGVRTQSIGDGFLRKLVIFPKKSLRKGKNSQNNKKQNRTKTEKGKK